METRATRRNREAEGARSERDLELDLEVGRRIEGYRWVEWNRDAHGMAPVDEGGRFIGHPGDLLAHLYVDARPGAPTSPAPYAHLPPYSTRAAPALRAAEWAGLFAGDGAVLACTPSGRWRVSVHRAGIDMEDDALPRLLCRAALCLAADAPGGEER